jgi:hypothetical protein
LLWDLYKLYAVTLELNTLFNPEKYLIDNNLDNYKWNDLKKAIIETEYDCYVQTCDVEVRRLRQITQPINLNPQIVLPQIPKGLNENQIKDFFQTWLNKNLALLLQNATKTAIETFLKTQPSGQIEIKIFEKL